MVSQVSFILNNYNFIVHVTFWLKCPNIFEATCM